MNAEIEQYQHGDYYMYGKWFVARKATEQDGEKPHVLDDDHLYLHQDGAWRWHTVHNGEWTGYFDTREEAEACLNRAMATETTESSDAEE